MKKVISILMILCLIMGVTGCNESSKWQDVMELSFDESPSFGYLEIQVKNISKESIYNIKIEVEFELKGQKWLVNETYLEIEPGKSYNILFNAKSKYENYTIKKITYK